MGRGELRVQAIALLLFLIAAALTTWMSLSMDDGMPMPGGWEMSMAWMPMGAGWLAGAAMFMAMWTAMMVAMMLPSVLPVLIVYRRTLQFRGEGDVSSRTWLAIGAYFAVWVGFGVVAYCGGLLLGRAAMASDFVSHAVPMLVAVALAIAGVWQLTPWKNACLAHCRDPIREVAAHLRDGRAGALRLGLRHGAWCAGCCWGLMLVQLAVGVMNLAAMALIATWIALEKLAPVGPRLARVGGMVALLGAAWLGWREIA